MPINYNELSKEITGGFLKLTNEEPYEGIFKDMMGKKTNNFGNEVFTYLFEDPKTGTVQTLENGSNRLARQFTTVQPSVGDLIRITRSGELYKTMYLLEVIGKKKPAKEVAGEVFEAAEDESEKTPF